MLSVLAPVLIDRSLDLNDVISSDGPFSDSCREHKNRIIEKGSGRQPKMQKSVEKMIGGRFGQRLGLPEWVENGWDFRRFGLLNYLK